MKPFGLKHEVSPPKYEASEPEVKQETGQRGLKKTPAWVQLTAFLIAFALCTWFAERYIYSSSAQPSQPQAHDEKEAVAWVQPHWYQGAVTDLEDGFDVRPLQLRAPQHPQEAQLQSLRQEIKRLREEVKDLREARNSDWRN